MNWKNEATDKLKEYAAKRHALINIPEEIARLESAMAHIRSAFSSGTPVKSNGSKQEDILLSNIVHREELERSLEQTQKWVNIVETGLASLDEDSRLILDKFYIHPEKGAADSLADELGLDVKTVYRRKDLALRSFTIALYGVLES